MDVFRWTEPLLVEVVIPPLGGTERLKTNYLKKASPAITRFVPGREGLGLTDRIDSVVDFMKQKNILVFDQNYGLWYDRRRMTTNGFAVGMVMYGDLSMNSHSVVAVREQHGKD